ncbi:hypothetical protein G9A89_019277 [Geosiphon pyriformis]|nr:hypothetical protein G9A89_019277 [Geosiphon pyriformis]
MTAGYWGMAAGCINLGVIVSGFSSVEGNVFNQRDDEESSRKRKRDNDGTIQGEEEEDVEDGDRGIKLIKLKPTSAIQKIEVFSNPDHDDSDERSNAIVASISAALEVRDDTNHGNNEDEIANDSNAHSTMYVIRRGNSWNAARSPDDVKVLSRLNGLFDDDHTLPDVGIPEEGDSQNHDLGYVFGLLQHM